ncbi:MAG: SOS response-associated peptidase [Deltaproteobacteria bacterium]|nr:SOS response-associated peptidase [Deltaproteobacteria bacterium]MBW2383444.1 SOS response-associated peptidase [Deltaproteobacteria bacterium]MBW2698244.1 SOS response-associated peptidase [Deltaproteobacteria bacterium]
MCGRMVLTRSAREIAEAFDVAQGEALLELGSSWNVAPTQEVVGVRADEDGSRRLGLLHWGLIPFWAKDRSAAGRMINARAETAAVKPSFRDALRRRRCIVPADGFYEWQRPEAGSKAPRVPHYFRRRDGGLLAIAGLWEEWTDKVSGEIVESCTLLTTDANEVVARIHHRMPVLLDAADYAGWLDPKLAEPQDVQGLLVAAPEDMLESIRVSTLVNSPRNNQPACIEPV